MQAWRTIIVVGIIVILGLWLFPNQRRVEHLRGPIAQVAETPPTHGVLGLHLTNDPIGLVRINHVRPGTPAAAAGIQPGDFLLTLNHQPTPTAPKALDLVQATAPGDLIPLTIQRDTQQIQLQLKMLSIADIVALDQSHQEHPTPPDTASP